ncbi:DNA primase [Corynebacterium diphtheriae]|nr:DNA primase [Corynebacterium diphtheriae]
MLGNGLGCYDIDHCYIDGVLDGWVFEFIKTIDEPIIYAERSISGEGLHVFIKTDERAGQKLRFMGKTVEAYTRQRFIRTTLNTAKEVMAYAGSGTEEKRSTP